MATSPYHISSLLDKMSSVDKDFRFMATNDLMTELQRDSIKLDDDSERKVVLAILKLVQDKNGEVQNLAVRCLGPLIRKVKDSQVDVIINELCTNMFSEDERLRDISSVGLKTVITQLPHLNQSLTNSACKNITERLLGSIGSDSLNQYVLLECLDILGDLVHKHGIVLSSFHEDLLHKLLPMLVDPKPLSIRKRACTALCYLSACCQQELYNVLLTQIIQRLSDERQSQSSLINVRTFLHCVGAISRQSGQRVNAYLPTILPLLMHFIQSEDDELKEACLQAFEVLVCFREISEYISEITDTTLKLLAHDPNYNYDSDSDDDDENDMETDDIEDEEDDSYSDDDDISWKVRRAAAKCVSAIISARPDLLVDFYSTVSPVLVTRFKEREETVKSDIFQAYRILLRVTKSSVRITEQDNMETGESPLSLLLAQVPDIVKALYKQLKDKSVKTRQGCFGLLTDLVLILHDSLKNEIGSLVPGVVYCLSDSMASSNLKIDCLVFLNAVCMYHQPNCIHPHIEALIPMVIKCVGDSFYKITSEALLVLQNIVKVIRPLNDVTSNFDFAPYADTIFTAAMNRLSAADIDQEVKERAITCMGQIVANLGDVLGGRLSECLPLYVNRLKNEITRLTTVKAVTMITKSTLKIDISSIQLDIVPLLASFLRKNHRDLRLATLACLNQLLVCYSIPSNLINEVLSELPQLISDNDLHISQQVLTVVCSIITVDPSAAQTIKDTIVPRVVQLLLSSLLQGNALTTVANFFTQLVTLNQPGLQFQDMFQMLVKLVDATEETPTHHRQTYYSISRCIAVMCLTVSNTSLEVVQKFVQDIENPSVVESNRLLALFSVGEIGKHTDLSSISNIQVALMDMFGSTSEEVRSAASYALGCVCAGNLETYLPFILTEIQDAPKKQYLLLHSLKEIITCYGARDEGYAPLKPYVGKIWDVLFLHFQTQEEGTRNVVAECVGKLILVEPVTLLPLLRANLESDQAHVRGTVITALKYTISDKPLEVDTQLSKYIGDFMTAISDPDLNVRRVALVSFNSAAHNKPSLIRDLLDTILPNLYNETKVRKELIRQVEMGPFKHTVDDGLDLRKAAFECMYTLLETCLDRLNMFEFLNHVEDGLRDHYDIKMLTFLLLVRVSHVQPSAVLQRIDQLVEPLKATVQTKVKANSVKQEFEKQEEIKRSAIRTLVALLEIPDAEKNPQLTEFLHQIKANPETATMLQMIQQDSSRSKSSTREEAMEH